MLGFLAGTGGGCWGCATGSFFFGDVWGLLSFGGWSAKLLFRPAFLGGTAGGVPFFGLSLSFFGRVGRVLESDFGRPDGPPFPGGFLSPPPGCF